ncbi:MAG: AAA family ATPase [Vicinamibacterales bacterium]
MRAAAAASSDASLSEPFYGFGQPPFAPTPDPRFLFRSESHGNAIAQLLQAIRRKHPFVVLTGDVGTGKTTICHAVLEQLDSSTFSSLILNPFLSIEELLRQALLDFGVVSRAAVRNGRLATASMHELMSTLGEFLQSLVAVRGSAVLIIDEAQHIPPAVLEQLRILSNLETHESKLLQIVLAGQLGLNDLLSEPNMRPLNQRISVRVELKPLNRVEIEAYIAHRSRVARGSSAVMLESDTLDLIHAFSGGVPRIINMLADQSLTRGADLRVDRITPAIVEEAAANLGLGLPPPARTPRRRRVPRWLIGLAAATAVVAAVTWLAPLDRMLGPTIDTPVILTLPATPAPPRKVIAGSLTPIPTPEELLAPPVPLSAP